MKTPNQIATDEMVQLRLSPNEHGDFTGAQLHALIARAIEADRAQRNFDNFYADIKQSLTIGIDAEADDPNLHDLVTSITTKQIEWISVWLAGEGFSK